MSLFARFCNLTQDFSVPKEPERVIPEGEQEIPFDMHNNDQPELEPKTPKVIGAEGRQGDEIKEGELEPKGRAMPVGML